jgi:hypothetical protein
MKTLQVGKLFGLQISIAPVALLGTLIVWAGFSLFTFYQVGLSLAQAIPMGFFAAFLHWTSELIHCLGHAYTAKQSGYPMTGIRFGTLTVLAQTQYPKDEPALPPSLHIRRALGGPIISGLFSILLYLLLPYWPKDWYWLGLFTFLENLFVYTLQVFLPFGFNDGSTILTNLRKKY